MSDGRPIFHRAAVRKSMAADRYHLAASEWHTPKHTHCVLPPHAGQLALAAKGLTAGRVGGGPPGALLPYLIAKRHHAGLVRLHLQKVQRDVVVESMEERDSGAD